MQVGDVISWRRTFTEDDVRLFSQASGDQGVQHILPDVQGRLMVQGLLTATLPTKIGGDLNFIARELTFLFHRPIFAGDTVHCEVTITELDHDEKYTRLGSSTQVTYASWARQRSSRPVSAMIAAAHSNLRPPGYEGFS